VVTEQNGLEIYWLWGRQIAFFERKLSLLLNGIQKSYGYKGITWKYSSYLTLFW